MDRESTPKPTRWLPAFGRYGRANTKSNGLPMDLLSPRRRGPGSWHKRCGSFGCGGLGRFVLSEGNAVCQLPRILRRALYYGRSGLDLLRLPFCSHCQQLGRADSRGLPILRQSSAGLLPLFHFLLRELMSDERCVLLELIDEHNATARQTERRSRPLLFSALRLYCI